MKRILALVLTIIMISSLCACGTTSSAEKTDTKKADENNVDTTENTKKEVLLVDDDFITAEFLGFDDMPSLGVFYVTLRVTNKTDQNIWVYLEEASVNDEMMQLIMSGTPLYILPEKKGSNAFIFSFSQISIDSFEDVEKVAFKIGVKNKETFADIEKTEEVTITKE